MLGQIEEFRHRFIDQGTEIHCPEVVQTLSISTLKELLPNCDGWIIGDDLATKEVLAAGKAGRLKAVVKWGVGVDNIDFAAAHALGIRVANTPKMFGSEVADVALGYLIGLARQTFAIDRSIRRGDWIKPTGISLAGRTVGLVGFGDIGKSLAKRLLAADMQVIVYDPYLPPKVELDVDIERWPCRLENADFLVFTCALTQDNYHMLSRDSIVFTKAGVRIVNVARGPLIEEAALIEALRSGHVHSAALDVYESEPLSKDSPLRQFESCILGSHNASNTVDAVRRTSHLAMELLFDFLKA